MATEIEVNLFDGRGERWSRPNVLLSVKDGSATTFQRGFVETPTVRIPTAFHNSPRDNHVILASFKGHRDAGFMPVVLQRDQTAVVNLMLFSRQPEFEFAGFGNLTGGHPALSKLFNDSFIGEAPRRYEGLQESAYRPALACMMNIVESLAIAELPRQTGLRPTLASYIEQLDLTPALDWVRPDRFFAWCHADIASALRSLTGLFARAPSVLHPGATDSFKQSGFGEANVQVTLHENDKGRLGQNLIKVEFDIDYFRDNASHVLLEVFPNALKRFVLGGSSRESLTDPAIAYGLRWMAGRQRSAAAQARPFAPAFTIKPAAA